MLGGILCGAAAAVLGVRSVADRAGRRRCYRGGYIGQLVACLLLVLSPWWWLLILAGLTGTLSSEINDSGPFGALEQVMLTTSVSAEQRLRTFSRYGAIGTASSALGALGAGAFQLVLPGVIGGTSFVPMVPLSLLGVVCAWGLSSRVEDLVPGTTATSTAPAAAPGSVSDGTRRTVRRLSAVFALDSFGAGFAVQAFVAYWLATRFGASMFAVAAIFLGTGLLQAGSMVVAGRLGERFGLLDTMVFTHLPSNVFLAAIPLAPSLPFAALLLCLRASLCEMDVPTRNAYVMALVPTQARTDAASTTSFARLLARPLGPLLAGLSQSLALGAPFVISGALKGIYDITLWVWFRRVPLSGQAGDAEAAPVRAERQIR